MDRFERTANVVKSYYSYKKTGNNIDFVREVCDYFDYIKDKPISESDMNFLLFLSNEAGVPQYYNLFEDKFTDCRISNENIKMVTLSSLMYDSSLIGINGKMHRFQKEIVERFRIGQTNRYVLSAPTSFGKTHVVYEIIKRMDYQNILLIFPAISLLSENYTKICEQKEFEGYALHSLSDEEYDLEKKNIFIFTPERFLSFTDVHKDICFDFSFIDEIYKIDNSFVMDQETYAENERDVAYRISLECICKISKDMLLVGPYIEFPINMLETASFNNFANDNHFSYLKYDKYEIVGKIFSTVRSRQHYDIDGINVDIGKSNKNDKIAKIVATISSPKENTLVYCSTKSATERYARALLDNKQLTGVRQERYLKNHESTLYHIFIDHVSNNFGDDWIVTRALRAHIGIHHSLIPKYIQKEIVNLFNCGELLCLFSTTTIMEGVNTSAKNIIITSNKKGNKPIKQFDAKNIAGRAGRFNQHYSGRVIDLDNDFEDIIKNSSVVLQHKNYDISASKTDVDYQITKEKYLSKDELENKKEIDSQIEQLNIPPELFDMYKTIGPKDKLTLYKNILSINVDDEEKVISVFTSYHRNNKSYLNKDGFQIILDIILPIIKEKKLKSMILTHDKNDRYSILTHILISYLSDGFMGLVNYNINKDNGKKTKDEAMHIAADTVYNVFKYHLVKYLGLFDIFFNYHLSVDDNSKLKSTGLGPLLQKLEYNAYSIKAKKVSDYGAPFKIIQYYEDGFEKNSGNFDEYESHVNEKILRLFE